MKIEAFDIFCDFQEQSYTPSKFLVAQILWKVLICNSLECCYNTLADVCTSLQPAVYCFTLIEIDLILFASVAFCLLS